MTEPSLDIIAIGNAIVDVLAPADEAFLSQHGMTKGAMRLLSADQATELYAAMGAGREISGGSAANTLAGAAALGAKCAFIGQVATDQLGEVFSHDIRSTGVAFETKPRDLPEPTARCLILVDDQDGQRTMNTYLGAAQYLEPDAIDAAQIASARILLLEGYLWDPAEPREAMKRAIRMAKDAGRKVALGVSAVFCILNHRADFLALLEAGDVDILFANEEEVLALAGTEDFEEAVAFAAARVPLLVTTRGPDGAIAIEGGQRVSVSAEPIDKIVDTTGAGDLFSAGFLVGHVQGRSNEESLRMGAIAAAEVISHWGARPEAKLDELVKAKLG
ncbi:sugar/nucleoside kinase (ribokinase family) [Sphingomonas vulcanisoli]|uniref:Sugar/nucleoside kinase (Ribokinase family) n=1 Tax=Sphingomonas vulcanisoli TaxID=1658060 RepID=A0ABX0TWK4_9SPHN|nr:sugar/nucleoside kinase (ribokinase family) [Sphingomonas vulcanisoli]